MIVDLKLKGIWFKVDIEGLSVSGTLDEVLAAGTTLTEDRTVDLNGKDLIFSDTPAHLYLSKVYMEMFVSDDPDRKAQLDLSSSVDDGYSFFLRSTNGINEVSMSGDGATGEIAFTGQIVNPTLQAADYADDTAASVAGVPEGGLYHTAGVLKIRLPLP